MIVRNKIVLILGRPGEGKSFLSVFMASVYPRIYSNIAILDKSWKTISNYIKNLEDVSKISFSPKKWVIVLDEWWINLNARDSMSSQNREFWELGILSRKLNVDIILCGQLGRMIDVYFRELAHYTFHMHAWFDRKDYLLFEAKIFSGIGENIVKVARFDLFEFSRLTWITYNSLETSRIEKRKKHEVLIPGEITKNSLISDYAPIWTSEADKVIGRIE